jgi:competence protein ComFA
LLVTTTILERGVTVPFVDVYILDADSQQFDSAALIQMAGRAGRSQQDPNGFVYFCAADWTSSQKEAVQHIRDMNRRASKAGAHA